MVDITGNVNPTFHVVFREDDGTPLIGGSVYFYKASDHSTAKAVYEDRELTIALDQPVPLNAAGIVSETGGAPKPWYLSDDENYYIEVYRAGESPPIDTPVQTVDNWNADNAFSTQPQVDEIVTTNFIPNAQFRSLVNDKTDYSVTELNATNNILIARDNWYLRRDVLTSQNNIEFKEFIVGQTDVPFNSKYYLNFACSVISTETEKDITIDLGDVETFSNQEVTFAIWAKSSTLSQIEILTDQDYGSGGSSQDLTIVDSFTLTSAWTQYSTTFTVADVTSKTVGTDNKFRIRVRMPLNLICDIDFVMAQVNLGNTVLEFDYQPSIMNDGNVSKDAIPQPAKANGVDDSFKSLSIDADGITNIWMAAVPTGSVIWYPLPTPPLGFLEGSGQTLSGIEDSTYRRLRNTIGVTGGYGEDGFIAIQPGAVDFQFITNNKFDTNVTDIADGTTGFTFATEQQGGDKGFSVARTGAGKITVTNKSNGAVTDATAGTTGFTVTVTQQGTAGLPEITDITVAGALTGGEYILISSVGTDYYVWFTVDNVGADPAVGGRTGIKIALTSGETQTTYAAITRLALSGCEQSSIIFNDASTLSAGDNFLIYNSTTTFVPWYRIDGAGTEPTTAGTKFPIDIDSSDLAAVVNQKTFDELITVLFRNLKISGYFIRAWDHGAGIDPDAASRWDAPDIVSQGDVIGTYQDDEVDLGGLGAPVWTQAGGGTFQSGGGEQGSVVVIPNGNETRPKNIYLMPIIKY